MVTEADFRQFLKGLGINPVRIEGYVLRENASKFKPPKVKKAPKVVPEYLTDDGQLRVNTAKEAFRRDLTSAAELEAALVALEMPPDLAEAYTQFEIIKFKAPKVKAKVPYYATDEGAIKLKTAKEEYQRGIITAEELYSQLIDLEMEATMAKAIVDNEVLLRKIPKLPPPKLPPIPVPYYLTEEGDLKMKAAAESYRKNQTTAEDLYAALVNLEMEASLAEAYVNLEILKKTPKAAG